MKAKYQKLLTTLISQIYLKPPILSVNSFFELGYKWMFVIIDATISYLVVVLFFFNKSWLISEPNVK